MNKKAITQQVFIYIFIMLVVALILIFGVKLIKQTTDLGKSVDISVFKKDLDNSVQQIYTYSARSSQNLIIKNIPISLKNSISASPLIKATIKINGKNMAVIG